MINGLSLEIIYSHSLPGETEREREREGWVMKGQTSPFPGVRQQASECSDSSSHHSPPDGGLYNNGGNDNWSPSVIEMINMTNSDICLPVFWCWCWLCCVVPCLLLQLHIWVVWVAGWRGDSQYSYLTLSHLRTQLISLHSNPSWLLLLSEELTLPSVLQSLVRIALDEWDRVGVGVSGVACSAEEPVLQTGPGTENWQELGDSRPVLCSPLQR